jgi:hypothetical protein
MFEGHFSQCPTRSGLSTTDCVEGRALKRATTGTEDIKFAQAGAGDPASGICTGNSTSGEPVGNAYIGPGMAEVLGNTVNIAAGDSLKASTNGCLAKALPGELAIAFAEEPCTEDNADIRIFIQRHIAGDSSSVFTSITGASGSVTAAGLGIGGGAVFCSNNGVCALAIPGGASVRAGTRLIVYKTGTAGAVTITPATGTIAGGATHTAIDAQNDRAEFISDGTNWLITWSVIA